MPSTCKMTVGVTVIQKKTIDGRINRWMGEQTGDRKLQRLVNPCPAE